MDFDAWVVVTELLDTAHVVVVPVADEGVCYGRILILENLLQILYPRVEPISGINQESLAACSNEVGVCAL